MRKSACTVCVKKGREKHGNYLKRRGKGWRRKAEKPWCVCPLWLLLGNANAKHLYPSSPVTRVLQRFCERKTMQAV
jgi:hypothetical protein